MIVLTAWGGRQCGGDDERSWRIFGCSGFQREEPRAKESEAAADDSRQSQTKNKDRDAQSELHWNLDLFRGFDDEMVFNPSFCGSHGRTLQKL